MNFEQKTRKKTSEKEYIGILSKEHKNKTHRKQSSKFAQFCEYLSLTIQCVIELSFKNLSFLLD